MKADELIRTLMIPEQSFAKVCKRLGISSPDNDVFSPDQVQRIRQLIAELRAPQGTVSNLPLPADAAPGSMSGLDTNLPVESGMSARIRQDPLMSEFGGPTHGIPEAAPLRSDVPSVDPLADVERRVFTERFDLLAILGEGGMGRVLKAFDRKLQRTVAIKRLKSLVSSEARLLSRFLREAQLAAKLDHANVVRVYDIFRDEEGPYLILEFVDGESLDTRLQRGPIPWRHAVELLLQICEGVIYSHTHEVIHRDIKPANILLPKDGPPKLADFGIARSLDATDFTKTGAMLGTIYYMAPEQVTRSKTADGRSDLYSLAATLYHMVSGEVPQPIQGDELPEEIREVLLQAVKRKPETRHQNVREFADALRRCLNPVSSDVDILIPTEYKLPVATIPLQPIRRKEHTGRHQAHDAAQPSFNRPLIEPHRSTAEVKSHGIHAIGIHLGMPSSSIAFLNEHGEPVSIPNKVAELATPSVVLFDGREVIIGTEALRNLSRRPDSVVTLDLQYMGDPTHHCQVMGKEYSSLDISTLILKELLDDARVRIGGVERAVITVPCWFSDVQRQAAAEAGKRAGLNYVNIISEAVAAALSFVLGTEGIWFTEIATSQTAMVVDLARDTFDVSIVNYKKNEVSVLANEGDLHFGEIDWNRALETAIAEHFQKEFGIDPLWAPESAQDLAQEVEKTIRDLSFHPKSDLTVVVGDHKKTCRIELEQFERLTKPLVDKMERLILNLLEKRKMGWAKIDVVLMTGGAARLPMVRSMFKRICGRTLSTTLPPDQSTAHGATYYAGMLLTNSAFAKSVLDREAAARQ